MSVSSAVVTVGEELLSGATIDSNAAWLGRALGQLGIPVRARWTVGDRDDQIARVVAQALAEYHLVVVTGGLGPTEDDRTRPAVARALGQPLEIDPQVIEVLSERYRQRGYAELPPANLRQAEVPRGGVVLDNPVGTAPGLWIPTAAGDGRVVVLLPGVPREMRALFEQVIARARARFLEGLAPVHSLNLYTTGIPESVLAPQVEEALGAVAERQVEVAYLPELTGVDLRLSVVSADARWADAVLHEAGNRLEPIIGDYRFEAPETGDLVEAVALRLSAAGRRMATAESCTGGGVAERLTGRPGASSWFVGGVVAYDNQVKVDLLGVDPVALERHGAVSTEVAAQMARGVLERTGADDAIALTGIAGPGGGSAGKPVGTVCWAVARRGAGSDVDEVQVSSSSTVFPGDREAVRVRSGQAALRDLYLQLGAKP